MKPKHQSFAGSAFILLASAFIVKIIGATFKIPLAKILGGSGMGYFMTAFGVFSPIFALAVAGVPIAVSKLISGLISSGKSSQADDIFVAAALSVCPFCLLAWALISMFSMQICMMLGNPLACSAVMAIAPSVFFVSITAVIRGYFEGQRNMIPTAISEVFESLVKLLVGITLAVLCISQGKSQFYAGGYVFGIHTDTMDEAMEIILPKAAACAIFGVTISCAFAAIMMIFAMIKDAPHYGFSPSFKLKACFGKIFDAALPVCLIAITVNISSIIDLICIPNGLEKALSKNFSAVMLSHGGLLSGMDIHHIPNFLYGCYTGMAMTIFNIIPSLAACLGVSALPIISGLFVGRKTQRLNQSVCAVVKSTLFLAAPCSVGIVIMARPILTLVFSGAVQEISIAVPLLKMLGVAAFFVSMSSPIINMLQAMGRPYVPVKLMFIGGSLKWAVSLTLLSIPQVNIFAAPLGTIICYSFVFFGAVSILIQTVPPLKGILLSIVKALCVSLISCIAIKFVYQNLLQYTFGWLAFITAVLIGAVIYVVGLLICNFFVYEDFKILFPNENFSKSLAKCGLIR